MKLPRVNVGSSIAQVDDLISFFKSGVLAFGVRLSWIIASSVSLFILFISLYFIDPHYFAQAFFNDAPSEAQIETELISRYSEFGEMFQFKPEHTPQDNYFFKYTSLGFGITDLQFFNELTREESEQKILATIPEPYRTSATPYIRPVLILSEKYQVDPLWVLSVMWTESHFRPEAFSHMGARGLMQILPSTKSHLMRVIKTQGLTLEVHKDDFELSTFFPEITEFDPQLLERKLINIELGIAYLKNLLKMFNYNHRYATVAYNMGPGWTLKRLKENLPVGQKNRYLDKVNSAYQIMASNI